MPTVQKHVNPSSAICVIGFVYHVGKETILGGRQTEASYGISFIIYEERNAQVLYNEVCEGNIVLLGLLRHVHLHDGEQRRT